MDGTQPCRIITSQPKAPEGVPEMPADLTAYEQEGWSKFVHDVGALGCYPRSMATTPRSMPEPTVDAEPLETRSRPEACS